jgi:hypothetical protein
MGLRKIRIAFSGRNQISEPAGLEAANNILLVTITNI